LNNSENWEVLLDLDALSAEDKKNWVFHGATWLSPKYEVCLLNLSDGGTDESIAREFNVEQKKFVEGGFSLPSSKGSAAWISGNELIISRNFGPGTMTTSGYPRIVKRWKRGTSLEEATTIMTEHETIMGVWAGSSMIEDENFVFISKSTSFYEHESYLLINDELVRLNFPVDANQQGIFKGQMLLRLNSDWKVDGKNFDTGSLVAIDFKKLIEGKTNVTLVYKPDERTSIDDVNITKDKLIVNLLMNVQNVLVAFELNDNAWSFEEIDTPAFGQISVMGTDEDYAGYFYQYSNFITPSTLYYVDNGEATIIRQLNAQFDAKNLEVHQYEAKSKDGTMIPFFVVHDKNMKYDGSNPALVYAYGGFNISNKPSYNTRIGIGWLEGGGVYVLANIRGGGEFGPKWHQAAMKENRQNAYDDFYAVCEQLIEKKISSPKHMGAFGWSNGGLMAGVVATQRPDLFNAVIIGAPLLDMKRFNKMLAGASWMGEYGNPDILEEWEFIKKYSPYHNVHADKKYPEVLFVTSTKDDRVHPAHARKMAARMMEQGHPIYYYETIEGGHGAASTNDQSAFNQALMFSYLKMKLMH
jgi:prolyl oligopeptidase